MVNRLKLARKKVHISQEKMAGFLKISTRTLQNYESGKTEMPNSKLSIFAKHCNTTVDWILTGEETEKNLIKETSVKYNDEITKLKADLWDMKKELDKLHSENEEFKKEIKKLKEEKQDLKLQNNKLRVGGALINSKGVTGSVKRGGP